MALTAPRWTARDLFDALQQLRRRLEVEAVFLLCCGARVDCYPSGMSRDMGLGRKVYVPEKGRRGRRADLVDLFAPATKELVGRVEEQDEYLSRNDPRQANT